MPAGQLQWAAWQIGLGAGLIASGGDLKAGLIGAVSGLAFSIGDLPARIAISAAVGGIGAEVQGGDFLAGMLSAGVSVGFASTGFLNGSFNVGKLIASSVVGGVASVLGGGKFKNGAVTGAMAYAISHAVQAGLGAGEGTDIFNDTENYGPGRELYDGKVLVRKYGSPDAVVTDAELGTVSADLEAIFAQGGVGGARLRDRILTSEGATTIILNSSGVNVGVVGGHVLTVDLNSQVSFRNMVTSRYQSFSTTRILAHELGHAILGIPEFGVAITMNPLTPPMSRITYPTVEFSDAIMRGIDGSVRGSYDNFCPPNCGP